MTKKYNNIQPSKVEVVEEVTEVDVKKTLEKVVTIQPKKVKKSLIGRLVSGVVGPDGVSGIGEFVNEEIVKPAIKNIIVDAVTSGINMIMYGERGGVSRGNRNYSGYSRPQGSTPQKTNYSSQYTRHNPEPIKRPNERNNRHTVEEYLIEDRYEASNVLTTLISHAELYGNVSLADYYDLIGVVTAYTDHQYGWVFESITRATIITVRGGFVIKFPPLEVI